MIFQYHGNCDQPSEVRPRSGKMLKNEPPAKRMISRIENRKPGMAKTMMITADVQVSNFDPPANRMNSRISTRKPGMPKTMIITAAVQVYNLDLSEPALRMPSGIEIR